MLKQERSDSDERRKAAEQSAGTWSKAITIIQRIAEQHHSTAISNLVSETEIPEGTTGRGSGASPIGGADVQFTLADYSQPDSVTETL